MLAFERYGDGVGNTVRRLLHNPNVLVATGKGMQAVKVRSNKFLQFLAGSAG